MSRDVWLIDDEPGCLECGALKFKESRVPGICTGCLSHDTSQEWDESYDINSGVEIAEW